MASFNFDNATLRLSYVTGVDESGKAIVTSKTYRNVRDNVEASQVLDVAQALASLSNYELSLTKKILTETVDM
ncbi:DUF1659 domain-containing protein [Lysinibacillus sp. SGAir0095]|uniref:DUF1659 domain-containing protein n=1 Tax=Lysinibacillus sp. SGAir0095 TaxID=2070463 RepID=UPI0010CD057F|nr:DUF1659 domain-containing protein [Lysinibacillus sp. SGAir0095]QCR32623.1 hypothetical protein C1N55_10775 [Lysinibacillus sp. SGAir0095]